MQNRPIPLKCIKWCARDELLDFLLRAVEKYVRIILHPARCAIAHSIAKLSISWNSYPVNPDFDPSEWMQSAVVRSRSTRVCLRTLDISRINYVAFPVIQSRYSSPEWGAVPQNDRSGKPGGRRYIECRRPRHRSFRGIEPRLVCVRFNACMHASRKYAWASMRAPCVMPAILLGPQEWFMHGRVTANLIQLQPANSPRRSHWQRTASGDSYFSGLRRSRGIFPRSIERRSRAYDTSSYWKR